MTGITPKRKLNSTRRAIDQLPPPAALEGVIAKLPGLAGYGAWTSSPAGLAPTCPTPAVAVVLINDPREESVHTATLVALPELDGTATSGRAVGAADFSYLPTSDERSQV